MRSRHPFVALALLYVATTQAATPVDPAQAPPAAIARPVVDDYFGTPVTDRYRYMESRDAETTDWMKAQGRYTRSVFDSIAARAPYLKTMGTFGSEFGFIGSTQLAGSRLFYLARLPGSDVYDLFVVDHGARRLLVDTAALIRQSGGTPHAIDWFTPTLDGGKVAVGISTGGSENSSMTVIDTVSGSQVAGPVDRAQFGSVSWLDDGSGLFFVRMQKNGMENGGAGRYKNLTVDFWDLRNETVPVGGPGSGKGPIRDENVAAVVSTFPHRREALLFAINGVQREVALWWGTTAEARAGRAAWKPLATADDGIVNVVGDRRFAYLQSHKDAPTFKILRLPIGAPLSQAKEIVPARPDRVVEFMSAASDALYVAVREGLWSRLLRVTADGAVTDVPLPYQASIGAVVTDLDRPGAIVDVQSWTEPPSHLRYDPKGKRFTDLKLDVHPPIDPGHYVATELRATATDGTQVPLSIITVPGPIVPRPMLLDAYGAYGISAYPDFAPRAIALVDAGANWAECHVRGGGDLGDAWRLGGKGPTKPNTWGDFAACAETLIAKGYTTAALLTVQGTSAGGIAVGRVATEHPELFAGAVVRVGDVNALRMERMPAGPANIPEFGTVTSEAGFKDLFAMDVIQHVRDDVRYPAFLITGGLNDPRVEPWEGAKLAARLQELPGHKPVLYRLEEEAGHGLGTTKAVRDAEEADIAAFVFWRAGVPGWQPVQPAP